MDLIELDDDYYEDKLYFTEPDALDQKFTSLEEDNLFYIHRIQEIEQYLESTQETIDKTHERLEKKTDALLENKESLMQKIAEAQQNLETYKKSSSGTQIMDQNSYVPKNATEKDKEKKAPQEVKFDDLLGQIKKKITSIQQTDTQKEPLQLLYVSPACRNPLPLLGLGEHRDQAGGADQRTARGEDQSRGR